RPDRVAQRPGLAEEVDGDDALTGPDPRVVAAAAVERVGHVVRDPGHARQNDRGRVGPHSSSSAPFRSTSSSPSCLATAESCWWISNIPAGRRSGLISRQARIRSLSGRGSFGLICIGGASLREPASPALGSPWLANRPVNMRYIVAPKL